MQYQGRQGDHGERQSGGSTNRPHQASSPIRKQTLLHLKNIVDTSSHKQQQSRTFRAKKMIVVSGGTLSSPLILQRSGIGDLKKLQKVGIKPIIDLPGVGTNFQDHYLTFSVFRAKPGMLYTRCPEN
jgi:choline dehydrogenase-like flavoprotein